MFQNQNIHLFLLKLKRFAGAQGVSPCGADTIERTVQKRQQIVGKTVAEQKKRISAGRIGKIVIDLLIVDFLKGGSGTGQL